MARFTFDEKTSDIVGPKEYMASQAFADTARRIQDGTHVLIGAFPHPTPIKTIVEVIFQTDYAAWLGHRQLAAMASR